MSARNTIMANLETALKGINKIDGYNVDINTVTREGSNFAAWADGDSPAIFIEEISELRIDNINSNERCELIIVLRCRYSADHKLSEGFNDFRADILKCLHAADLGTNFIYLRTGDLETAVGIKMIDFNQPLSIFYYYSEASP